MRNYGIKDGLSLDQAKAQDAEKAQDGLNTDWDKKRPKKGMEKIESKLC